MMKVSLLSIVLLSACAAAKSLPGQEELDLEYLSKLSPTELDQLAGGLAVEELIRTKRSGSGDILGTVGKTIQSGIGNKISLLGRASAGASAFFSGGSSKGTSDHQDGYSYGPAPMMYHTKSFDFWTLKKSILNTLLQAVKAITGGVTILKGQLIKGGGALVSGVGKIVSTKGDAVTNLGRHIVNSASLVQPKKKGVVGHEAVVAHSSPSGPSAPITSYGTTAPSGHYGTPSGPPAHYGAPSAPSSHYGAAPSTISHYEAPATNYYGPPITHNNVFLPTKYAQPFEGRGKPHGSGLQAGFILLKPVEDSQPTHEHDSYSAQTGPPASFVSSALQALKGILKGPTGEHDNAPAPVSETASGPETSAPANGGYKDTIFHPPPPLPSGSGNSYSDHSSNSIPAFKPLNYDLNGHSQQPSPSYGQPAEYHSNVSPAKFQTMVDSLIESQYNAYGPPGLGPTFDSLLSSFPNPESSHSLDHNSNYVRHLQNYEIKKIFDNVDKIKLQRSDDQTAAENRRDARKDTKKVEKVVEKKPVEKPKQGNSDYTDGSFNPKAKHTVAVDKSITYELRGNRIVRLTDGIADV